MLRFEFVKDLNPGAPYSNSLSEEDGGSKFHDIWYCDGGPG